MYLPTMSIASSGTHLVNSSVCVSHFHRNKRKYHFCQWDSLLCELPAGHALCLLFMGTCSRNFAGKPPSRMLLEDLPGGVCTDKVWPCRLSQNPCLMLGGSLTPAEKAAVFITQLRSCLWVSPELPICLLRGFWTDFCHVLRSDLYVVVYTKCNWSQSPWPHSNVCGIPCCPEEHLLGPFFSLTFFTMVRYM